MIVISCGDPAGLLKKFKAAVALDNEKGGISTWKDTGDDTFTHESSQFGGEAVLGATVHTGELRFKWTPLKEFANLKSANTTIAYYHGHMTQTFLTHFSSDLTSIAVTPVPVIIPKKATLKK